MIEKIVGTVGPTGPYGPNDGGYITHGLLEVAKKIKSLQELWSEGHYPHSNAKLLPPDHGLVKIQNELRAYFNSVCHMGNTTLEKHKNLFEPYVPSAENQTRWDKYIGEDGQKNSMNGITMISN